MCEGKCHVIREEKGLDKNPGVPVQRQATYVLVKARVVKVNRIRPGVVVPDIICKHIKPPRKNAFL